MDTPEYEATNFPVEDDEEWLNDPDLDDGNYVYIQEGDLSEILDEGDVMTALASYREVRQALRDRRMDVGTTARVPSVMELRKEKEKEKEVESGRRFTRNN